MGQHDRAPDNPRADPHADPLIDEVRQARRELSERFDNEVHRLAEYLREVQRRSTASSRSAPAEEHRDAG